MIISIANPAPGPEDIIATGIILYATMDYLSDGATTTETLAFVKNSVTESKNAWDGIVNAKDKPQREKAPKNLPPGTVPLDQSNAVPRGEHQKLKKRVGNGAKDWTGITPDGDVIVNDGEGNPENVGKVRDFLD